MLTNEWRYRVAVTIGALASLVGAPSCAWFFEPDANFSISAAPSQIVARPGDHITINGVLTCGYQFDESVAVGLSGLPGGVVNSGYIDAIGVGCSSGDTRDIREYEFHFNRDIRTAAPGTYTLTVYGSDGNERHESEVVLIIEPDDESPTVNISNPLERTYYSPVSVVGTAVDNGGVARVAMSLDGGSEQALNLENITGTFWGSIEVSPGAHVITVRAWDGSGNVGSATREFVLDQVGNEPPSVAITRPADGAMFAAGETVTFEGTATDVEDGQLPGEALVWTSDRDGALGSGLQIESTGLSSGSHVITLTATDGDGATAAASVTIQVGSGSYECSQFTFTMAPASVSVPMTGSATITITLYRAPGFTAPVAWTLTAAGGADLEYLLGTREFDPAVSTGETTVLTLAPGVEVGPGMVLDLIVTGASEDPQAMCTQPLSVTFVE